LLIGACSGTGLRWNSQLYRVDKNDTLYAIAWRYGLDYRELARWNSIAAPYIIHPGQELILIDPQRLPAHRRTESGSLSSGAKQQSQTRAAKAPQVAPPPASSSVDAELPPPKAFQWPADGKVVATFQGNKSGSQGIDIQSNPGQPVLATAGGKVVYSGNGLNGYGNLVIVKHNDTYLSAYAHNSKLLVKEGDLVESGQQIAEIGMIDHSTAGLHFEIRKQGKPVDPLKYLPKR
ncbi:MAG TPA: peptidoglycan DD-metalloendopeptidase family protein, partial [Gammaproteobacteria bacterium]